jgi:hypothetical protein
MKLNVLSRILGSFPSLGYALIYLLLIPVFAGIYYSLPTNYFYHSTIQYEYQTEQTFERSKNELFKIIKDDFKKVPCIECEESDAFIYKWSVEGWTIEAGKLDNFKLEDNQCSFDLFVFAGPTTSEQKKISAKQKRLYSDVEAFPLHVTFSLDEEVSNNSTQGVKFDVDFQTKKKELNDIFLQFKIEKAIFPKSNGDMDIELSKQTLKDMKNYISGKQGYGSAVDGNFARMIYLSAVTITTLGFGDIVPLTSEARILISIESVLGVVVIGLFLNSLSYERSKIEELRLKNKC